MTSLQSNENNLIDLFNCCSSSEEKYQKIIALGNKLKPINSRSKVKENLVPGCQSVMYLETNFIDNKIFFNADSEALISKGLAFLLIPTYSGLTPEIVLKHPPTILEKIGLSKSLSPSRSNGFNSLYLKMKQESLKYLI